jgi:monofunctional biosynthetic peptidoglycan transglycosylase
MVATGTRKKTGKIKGKGALAKSKPKTKLKPKTKPKSSSRSKIKGKSRLKSKFKIRLWPKTKHRSRKRKVQPAVVLIKKAVILLIVLHMVFFGFTGLAVFSYNFINPPTTSLALYRSVFDSVKNKPVRFVPLRNIPREIQDSLIRLEDPTFRKHHGLDIRAMRMAYKLNRRYKKKIAGGSTITQQLARTLFLTTHKSYLRKYMELIISLQLEAFLSKNRIMELYFNYVEFGKGVYGLGAASRYHYGTSFYNLSKYDIKKLLIILPSPVKYGVNDINARRTFIRRQHILLRPQPQIITPSTGPVVFDDD